MIQNKAVKYMMVSAAAFAIMNIMVKHIDHFHAFQLVLFRASGSMLIGLVILKKAGVNIFGHQKKLLLLRGIVGVTSMLLFFMSIKYLPIGSAVSLRYLSPIFAAFIAVLVLKEKMHPIQWLFFMIAFAGVLLMKGFDSRINGIGLALIIGSAFFSGFIYVIIRSIGTRDHPIVIVNYFMVIATIIGGIGSIFNWVSPIGIEWLILISLGLFGFLGQLFMTKAMQIEEANKIAPLKYLEVIYVLIFAYILLGEEYTILSLVGIAMIVLGLWLNLKFKIKK